jgi:Cupin domain
MRLIVADHDLTMGPGEAAEFDTCLPHWFGCAGEGPVEILSLFGRQGERLHVRAAPRSRRDRPRDADETTRIAGTAKTWDRYGG